MFEIHSYLLFFLSSVLVGSVSSSQSSPQSLDVFPVPFTEGRDETVFLGVANSNLTNKGSTSCASSVPPFGETGTLETMPGPWELRLMMPEFHKLLTGGAKTVEIDLVFGDATCEGVQESATEVELIQSTQQQQGAVLFKDPPPLITMSSCYLKINLEINISASPNWEGGEEPIFVLKHDLNFSTGAESVYEFQPCFSYLTFNNENDVEINYRKPCPSDDGRFLQETGASSCSSPHNQTSAPISDPPSIAPSTTSTSLNRFQHYGAMMVTGFAIMIAFLS